MNDEEIAARKISIGKYLLDKGYFSEYLPDEFNINGLKDTFDKSSAGKEKPYSYTMSKLKGDSQRRQIQIPELVSYLAVVEKMKSNILEKIIVCDFTSEHSFSKLFIYDEIARYSNPSDRTTTHVKENDETDSNFTLNLQRKIKSSQGAKGILYLDIANFFGSFYTHNTTAIFKGEEWAQTQYNFTQNGDKSSIESEYYDLDKIDKAIMKMNIGRTHGLLTGPFISKMIAEALMCTIDVELADEGIEFLRFMDDYEVFIYDEKTKEVTIKKIEDILHKYGFIFNGEKTKYVPFPYTDKKDLTPIFESDKNQIELVNAFNHFVRMEEIEGQKGAIKYFLSRIEEIQDADIELVVALIVNSIVNNPNSTIIAINSLINAIAKNKVQSEKVIKCLEGFLSICINNSFDLEQIWIVYAILRIQSSYLFKKDDMLRLSSLALVVLIGEKNKISKIVINSVKGKCFILDYELWTRELISDEDFFGSFRIDPKVYSVLKQNQFRFYKKHTKLTRVK